MGPSLDEPELEERLLRALILLALRLASGTPRLRSRLGIILCRQAAKGRRPHGRDSAARAIWHAGGLAAVAFLVGPNGARVNGDRTEW
jgi:hypothetical protein